MRQNIELSGSGFSNASALRMESTDEIPMHDGTKLFTSFAGSIDNLCSACLPRRKVILMNADVHRIQLRVCELCSALKISVLAVFFRVAESSVILPQQKIIQPVEFGHSPEL